MKSVIEHLRLKTSARRIAILGLLLVAVLAVTIPSAAVAVGSKAKKAPPAGKALRALKDRHATKGLWRQLAHKPVLVRRGRNASLRLKRFRPVTLNRPALSSVLAKAPRERTATARRRPLVISLPAPTGGFQRFTMERSQIMAPALARKHPEIKTYSGRGIDDLTASIRVDISPLGFHASVRSAKGAWYIDPYRADQKAYASYYGRDLTNVHGIFVERDSGSAAQLLADSQIQAFAGPPAGDVLRTYRLALVTDPSYATFFGAENVTAAKVALMNRVNQIYEDETSIRLVLIAANDLLNLNTAALATQQNGPCGAAACFTPAQIAVCSNLARIRIVAGQIVGASNYDIGHLALGVNGGGVASLGVVGGNAKAQGCTGLPNPVGDFYAVDYVAHEMGHQFAGNHTFNGNQVNCSGNNRSGGTSVEPGSGSSIMAYAGICRQDDLQPHSDPYWSQRSFEEITTYVTSSRPPINEVQTASLRDFSGGDEVQVVTLTGFNPATQAFQVQIAGESSATIGLGELAYNAANVAGAINAIPGFAGGATIATVANGGFTVTFTGASAATDVSPLSIVNCLPTCSGFSTETFKGGATNDSFTVTFGGSESAPIVRSSNYTAAGIQQALQGITEVQQVALTGYDTNGDSYTLAYNGSDSVPITRGQNNTTAGVQAAIQGGNEQQQVSLTGFSGATSSYQIQIGGNNSAILGSGGLAINNANVAAAVNAIPGFAGTVTSAGAGNGGFTLTFAGASANTDVPSISIVNLSCSPACTSVVRENVKGTTGIPGWLAGATVTIGGLTDAGYTVAFNGLGDVSELAVTNVSGVAGAVTTTTTGTSGILPTGATGTVAGFGGGNFDGTGFQVSFAGTLSAQNLGSLEITDLDGATAFVGETAKGGAIDNQGFAITPTGNSPPQVITDPSYTIPYRTPFALTGSATDAEGDIVTYLWEQNDIGAAAVALVNPNKTTGPLFRQFGTALDSSVYDPSQYESPGENHVTTDPTRVFPDLTQILSGNTNAATGDCAGGPPPPPPPSGGTNVPEPLITCYSEFLPTGVYAGPMHFRLTARDGHSGGGGISSSDTEVALAPGTGPFLVTSHATPATVDGGSTQDVAWDVAGTDAAPIGTSQVKISLSVDGGFTYPHVLAASAANDGSESVALPNVATSKGRIKVEAVGNIFFDVSEADLTVSGLPVVTNDAAGGTASVQYSDALAPTVTISATDGDTAGAALVAAAAGLPAGLSLVDGSTSENSRTWKVAGNVTAGPGSYPVTVTVTDDAGHVVSTSFTIVVTAENAAAAYTGDTLAFRARGSSTATVLLRTTVRDAVDSAPGDIRNATVTFKRGATTLCGPLPVALLGAATTTGAAGCSTTLGSGSHTIDVLVDGFYSGQSSRVVRVLPPEDGRLKADGELVAASSAGTYAANAGSRVEFDVDARFRDDRPASKAFDGDVEIEFRSGGRQYEIESDDVDSLGTSISSPWDDCRGFHGLFCTGLADLRATAELKDVTPKKAVRVARDLTLQVTASDTRLFGDSIAITLWQGNTLLFSSRWTGSETLEQRLHRGHVDIDS